MLLRINNHDRSGPNAEVPLKNAKIIVINAFSRGGSNIAWNIMQSHPQVCSPAYETGEILFFRMPRRLQFPLRHLYTNRITNSSPLLRLIGRYVDRRCFKFKLQNLTHPDNRFESEDVVYTEEKVEQSVLCLKSLDQDIDLTDFLARVYGKERCYFIGLLRNGYAVCEGWLRRGGKQTAREGGKIYRRYVEKMIKDSESYPHYTLVRFEDILADPFGQAERLYRFAGLQPARLEKLRLKVKKVLSREGGHSPTFGEENQKYWFTRENIHDLLVPDISQVQAAALSLEDRNDFVKEAKHVLDYFGYSD